MRGMQPFLRTPRLIRSIITLSRPRILATRGTPKQTRSIRSFPRFAAVTGPAEALMRSYVEEKKFKEAWELVEKTKAREQHHGSLVGIIFGSILPSGAEAEIARCLEELTKNVDIKHLDARSLKLLVRYFLDKNDVNTAAKYYDELMYHTKDKKFFDIFLCKSIILAFLQAGDKNPELWVKAGHYYKVFCKFEGKRWQSAELAFHQYLISRPSEIDSVRAKGDEVYVDLISFVNEFRPHGPPPRVSKTSVFKPRDSSNAYAAYAANEEFKQLEKYRTKGEIDQLANYQSEQLRLASVIPPHIAVFFAQLWKEKDDIHHLMEFWFIYSTRSRDISGRALLIITHALVESPTCPVKEKLDHLLTILKGLERRNFGLYPSNRLPMEEFLAKVEKDQQGNPVFKEVREEMKKNLLRHESKKAKRGRAKGEGEGVVAN